MGALYRSLDERVKEVREEVKPILKREMAAFPPVDPASVYRMYLRDQAASKDPLLREASERALKRFEEKKAVARDDLAALGLIALKMTEVKKPDARHLVIDEAQDFSALEFQLLARLAPGATLTAVGDLMQSIGAGGITDWEQPPSLQGTARRELTVSYRSTVEIMAMAEKVFAPFSGAGHPAAQDRVAPRGSAAGAPVLGPRSPGEGGGGDRAGTGRGRAWPPSRSSEGAKRR